MRPKKFPFTATSGVASDELILAGALLASAGAFVVVAMPWEGVFKPGSTQMVEKLSALETANVAFFDRYRLWPHQVTDGSPVQNAAVLIDQAAMRFPYSTMAEYNRLLPTDAYTGSAAEGLTHTLGTGGQVTQELVRNSNGRLQYLITMQAVPLGVARQVDAQIDGAYDPLAGRVRLDFGTSVTEPEAVTLQYYANEIS